MKKLKVAFLWHQHQPYYKMDNEFILPWVLLHGTKDYFDIPEVLYEFPKIKQTFNFAPSLSLQIEEYISGKTKDRIQRLTELTAASLKAEEKMEILNLFFHANFENMISPYPRYLELYNRSLNADYAIREFSPQDWLDLQVWYNLTWFGYYSKQSGIPKRLFEKGRDFSEVEKHSLQQEQNEILKKINYQYRKLKELEQIEISCSPMFHPILPLVIDSSSSLECRPEQKQPVPAFRFPQDAELQLKEGLDYFKRTFGEFPAGVWPSEGSVSDDTLNLMVKNKVKWIATDEQILFDSLPSIQIKQTEKFFPRRFDTPEGSITVLFRDHFLSDRIGFTYAKWNERDAAADFIYHLRSIRNEVIKNHGEDSLDSACVSVILDGENCWEYYKDNGIPFLRELFRELGNSEELITVTCGDACNSNSFLPALSHIRAGSWINANFDIWIGHEDDLKAWNMLSKARHELEKQKNNINSKQFDKSLRSLMIAEGSDWFWWYGPEHQTIDKPDFDRIFRHYIHNAYEDMSVEAPEEVFIPIEKQSIPNPDRAPERKLENLIGSKYTDTIDKQGYIKLTAGQSAMHRIGDFLDSVNYANDENYFYIKLNFIRKFSGDYEIKLFIDNINKEIITSRNNFITDIANSGILRYDEFLIISLPLNMTGSQDNIQIRIETKMNDSHFKYPSEGPYNLKRVF
ncbi:MAG: glycoside hydrolase family 57 protein [Candidatus Kapabacteria bacterium]|nr:glycoside hydrolase family 57 protein [Candidatus Kapabacteria bacterium]